MVIAPRLAELKEHPDDALRRYGLVLGSSARSRELDLMILTGPCQLEIVYDSNFLESKGLCLKTILKEQIVKSICFPWFV